MKKAPYPHETPLTEYLWSGAVLTFTEVIILQRRQWSRKSDGDIKAPSPAELGLIEEQTAHLSEQWGLSDLFLGCRRNLLLTWRPPALLVTNGEGLLDDNWTNIDPSAWDMSSGSDSLIDNNSCFIRSISVALSGLLALVTALLCVCLNSNQSFPWWQRFWALNGLFVPFCSDKPADCFYVRPWTSLWDTAWFIHPVT